MTLLTNLAILHFLICFDIDSQQIFNFLSQATKLNQLVKKYSECGVVFGSYPVWVNNYYKVRLTVEAATLEILSQVDKVTFYEQLLLFNNRKKLVQFCSFIFQMD